MQPHRDMTYRQQLPTEQPMWIESPPARVSPGLVVFLAIMFLVLLIDTGLLLYVFFVARGIAGAAQSVSSVFGG